jgi:predicted transglutaminase-like protease
LTLWAILNGARYAHGTLDVLRAVAEGHDDVAGLTAGTNVNFAFDFFFRIITIFFFFFVNLLIFAHWVRRTSHHIIPITSLDIQIKYQSRIATLRSTSRGNSILAADVLLAARSGDDCEAIGC